jgi:hypothetical protein
MHALGSVHLVGAEVNTLDGATVSSPSEFAADPFTTGQVHAHRDPPRDRQQ